MESTAPLLRCAKFDVVSRAIHGRDGNTYERQYVVHPGAVVVLPLLEDGRIVMVNQYRPTVDRRLLELPAGTLDVKGEDPQAAAARELEEESGYRAGRFEPLCAFYPSPGILTEKIQAYEATGLTRSVARPEPTEDLHVELVRFDDAVKRILAGEIMDAKTIITLLYYKLREEEEGGG